MFSRSVRRVTEAVTRTDLDQAVTTLRGETTQLRDAMGAMEARLRTEMEAMEARLSKQIKQSASEIAQEVANVMVEHSHVADLRLHRGPPATPAKRARRS
jgi:hypothetical protein